MTDFYIRPATRADLTAVIQLVAAQLTADFQGVTFAAADLEKRWQGLNLETDTWLALAEGTAVAYLDLTRERSVALLFLADAAYADAGSQLLQMAEKRLAARATLTAQIGGKNKTLQQIYARAGYRPGLTFSNMEIVMADPPPPPQWPAGITVRPFDPAADAYATYLADEEASQDKGYHTPLSYEDWRQRMRLDGEDFDPACWFIAWAGEEIAGICLCMHSPVWEAGWVDHLGVRRPYRRQGLGRALLLHALAHFYRRGIPKVMLNVDSGSLTNAPRLYESAGMQVVQQYHIYRKEV